MTNEQKDTLLRVKETLENDNLIALTKRLDQIFNQTDEINGLISTAVTALDNTLFDSYSGDLMELSLFRDWLDLLMSKDAPMNTLRRLYERSKE